MRAFRPDPGAAADAAPAIPASGAVRLPQWVFPLVTAISLILGATSIVRSTRLVMTASDSDLTNFFLRSADYILRGDPWHMYAVRAQLTYPNFNPPLSMFLLAPLLGLARAFGFTANYGEQITFVTLPFIVLVPLMGYLGLRVMRALYPSAPETLRLLLYVFITLSPLTWQSYSIWYHVEQPLMLCFLLAAALALQQRRPGLAGALAGLAFLTRTTALIPLIALGVILLMTREWRPLVKFGGVSAVIAALGFAPFILFDTADVKYTFLTWRGSALIGSDSIWTIFAYTGKNHLLALADGAAKRLDTYVVMLFVVAVAFFAVRRLRLTVYARDLWALLAIAMLATPMLSKQVWPYYYLEPMIFIAVWELSTLQDRVAGVWRWPVLSIGFTLVASTLSPYIGLRSVGRLDALVVGVAQTALMAAFVWGVWKRIQARKTAPVTAASTDTGGMQPMTPPGMAVAAAASFGSGFSAPQPAPQAPQAPRSPQQPQRAPAGAPAGAPGWPPATGRAGGATPPRGQVVAPGAAAPGAVPGVAGPLWPSDGNLASRGAQPPLPQEWRSPGAPPQPSEQAPRPATEPAPAPDGAIDPWRDWPQQRR